MPDKLLVALKKSDNHYDTKKDVDDWLRKPTQVKAEETTKAIRYHHLFKLFSVDKKISIISNPQVK